jgi:hypothetical protein
VVDTALEDNVAFRHGGVAEFQRELAVVVANDLDAASFQLREQQLLLDPNAREQHADA